MFFKKTKKKDAEANANVERMRKDKQRAEAESKRMHRDVANGLNSINKAHNARTGDNQRTDFW